MAKKKVRRSYQGAGKRREYGEFSAVEELEVVETGGDGDVPVGEEAGEAPAPGEKGNGGSEEGPCSDEEAFWNAYFGGLADFSDYDEFDDRFCEVVELPEFSYRAKGKGKRKDRTGDSGPCACDGPWEDGEEVEEERSVRNIILGKRGEQATVRYLRMKGYEIVDTNWDCPAGEADIVAMDGDTLVFVEVKTRTSLEKGLPELAVTPRKRAKYEKIAAWYMHLNDAPTMPVRFDVVGLLVADSNHALIRHYVNAFGMQGDW